MTLVLFITLYFDVLKKLISGQKERMRKFILGYCRNGLGGAIVISPKRRCSRKGI